MLWNAYPIWNLPKSFSPEIIIVKCLSHYVLFRCIHLGYFNFSTFSLGFVLRMEINTTVITKMSLNWKKIVCLDGNWKGELTYEKKSIKVFDISSNFCSWKCFFSQIISSIFCRGWILTLLSYQLRYVLSAVIGSNSYFFIESIFNWIRIAFFHNRVAIAACGVHLSQHW